MGKLSEDEYHVFNDVILPTQKGTSQIDHIVVSEYGIFVIETKFYNGWIFGGEYSEYWTQNLYGHKTQFYNPILQNQGHVWALKMLLKEYEDIFIYPIVTFLEQATLKVRIEQSCVIYRKDITKTIRRFTKKRLTHQMVSSICELIENSRVDVKDNETLRKHNMRVWSAQIEKDEKIKQGLCPRCSGRLVIRKGKNGYFQGCSNYPRCRYTRNL